MNESKTEQLVRNRMRSLKYYSHSVLHVEEKASDNPRIQKLLKQASKRGHGIGYPEFLVHSEDLADFLIVIECKASPQKHESESRDKFADYAVDGALLYASYLAKEYDVLAIGVSGETHRQLTISHYLHLKGAPSAKLLPGGSLLAFSDYHKLCMHDEEKYRQEYEKLLEYSKELNEILHAKKIKEAQRSLLISGILIALSNPAFRKSFKSHRTAEQLARSITTTVIDELSASELPQERVVNLRQAFGFIETHATLSTDKPFVQDLIVQIDDRINSFIRTYQYYDTIGQFYIEFLRYANNDKGLGIVLTPPHITDLFSRLAKVNEKSKVVDNCCGTGGFLISAMRHMIASACGNNKLISKIQKNQLVGIEFQDDIYALAVTNMVIHGDGKSNVHQGDCFLMSDAIRRKYKPNVGFLNPPYKTKKSDIEELEFVLNNLEMLEPGATCIAIIPISCVIAQSAKNLELKKRLLKSHTLEAVMSMPSELFHDSRVGVVTAVIVLTAHTPHPTNKKSWFGYWREDGFIKTKHLGRIDLNNRWPLIRDRWVEAFQNREVHSGESVMQKVAATDEWCAEAYMETDYSSLSQNDFERSVREYAMFRLLGAQQAAEEQSNENG